MNIYDATEMAYKNGYEQGYVDGLEQNTTTIFTACQARKVASKNTPTSHLVSKIMADIAKACKSGRFNLIYWPEGETNYTIRKASKTLRDLGYEVVYNDNDDEVSLVVSWEE